MYNVSWNEFENLAIELAKKIIFSKKEYSAVIGVSRGGLLVSRLLSSMLEIPMGVISAKWVGGKYVIDSHVSMIYELEGPVLLVDDVLEDTCKEIIFKINKNYPKISEVSTACIFYKSKSKFKPDFYISDVKDMLTIIFPYQEKKINENLKFCLE